MPAGMRAPPWLLLLLVILPATGSDPVLCFTQYDESSGKCKGLLGKDIGVDDCCLNAAYAFQEHDGGLCQACSSNIAKMMGLKILESSSGPPVMLTGPHSGQHGPYGGPAQLRALRGPSCDTGAVWAGVGTALRRWLLDYLSGSYRPVRTSHAVQRWVAGLSGDPGSLALSRVPKEPRPVNENVIILLLSVGATAQERPSNHRPVTLRRSAPHTGPGHPGAPGPPVQDPALVELKNLRRHEAAHVLHQHLHNSPPGSPAQGQPMSIGAAVASHLAQMAGGWGPWAPLNPCPVTCGLGQIVERRTCDNPAPRHGGRFCAGDATRNHICNTAIPCPVNGEWEAWGKWSHCSRVRMKSISCDEIPGQQSRSRTCGGRKFNGQPCTGKLQDIRHCYDIHNCVLKGSWSQWSTWGLCTPPCGPNPTRVRQRLCTAVLPKYSPTVSMVEGQGEKNVTFWGTPRPLCEALQGQKLVVEEKRPCLHVPACKDPEEKKP
ncbi:Properdin [Apodemus speciosus]|uniref:Properdin n=1 Tax=Apodemus speciosus TaxID=105296 RepID=A0ABQ0FTU9_APOSI